MKHWQEFKCHILCAKMACYNPVKSYPSFSPFSNQPYFFIEVKIRIKLSYYCLYMLVWTTRVFEIDRIPKKQWWIIHKTAVDELQRYCMFNWANQSRQLCRPHGFIFYPFSQSNSVFLKESHSSEGMKNNYVGKLFLDRSLVFKQTFGKL